MASSSFACQATDLKLNPIDGTGFRGGHFAALEGPNLMLADLRAFIVTVSEK